MADERELTAKQQIQQDINKSLKSESEITSNYAKLLNEQLNTQKEITKQIRDRVKVLQGLKKADNESSDIHNRINRLQKEASKTADKLSKSRRADGKFAKGYNQLIEKGLKNDKGAQFAKLKQLKLQRLSNLAQSTANTLSGGMLDKVKGITKFVGKVGPGFAVATAASLGLVAAIGLGVKALKFVAGLTDKFGQTFGVIGAQASDFQSSLLDASIDVISLGKGADDVATVVSTLSSEFGIGLQSAQGITEQILDTAVATGLATGEATKLFGTLMTIGGLSADQAENLTESTYQLAAQNRVNPAAVMQDIAESSETIAKFGASNLDSISKAAVKARALGTNLSSVASAAEGFLDFQSSLTAEFEAEALLGQNLELSRARQLSLAGDLDGVLDEIVKNVGSEEKLNRMNVIQRRALAKALNMDVQQLSKLVRLQGKSVVQQKQFADLAGEDGLSALTSISNKFKEIGATALKELGEPLLKALKKIEKAFFTPKNIERVKEGLKSVVSIVKSIAKAVISMFKGIYNVVDFLTFGSLPNLDTLFPPLESVMVNDFSSSGGSHLVITPSGQALKTNPRDTVFGTTTPVNDFTSGPAGSMGMANKETNGLLNRIIQQNETMIRAIERNPSKLAEVIERF
jgi:hypothetical protein